MLFMCFTFSSVSFCRRVNGGMICASDSSVIVFSAVRDMICRWRMPSSMSVSTAESLQEDAWTSACTGAHRLAITSRGCSIKKFSALCSSSFSDCSTVYTAATSTRQTALSSFAVFIRFSLRTMRSCDDASSSGASSSSSLPSPKELSTRSWRWCVSPSSSFCSSMGSSRAAPG